MREEWAITREEACEAARLICEYLQQGGSGFDSSKLEQAVEALMWADRIRIVAKEEDLDDEY